MPGGAVAGACRLPSRVGAKSNGVADDRLVEGWQAAPTTRATMTGIQAIWRPAREPKRVVVDDGAG